MPNLRPGALYGYRVHGNTSENGHRFNASKLLAYLMRAALPANSSIRHPFLATTWSAEEDKDLTFDTRDNAADMVNAW